MNKLYAYCLYTLCALLLLQATPVQATVQCTGIDATYTSVTLTGVGNGKISYDVTIKNAGTLAIAYNKLTLANYTSTDNAYDGSDASGGSVLVSTINSGTLAAGQEHTISYYCNYTGDIKTLPYLILQLSYQDAECDATNNQVIVCTKPNPVLNDIAISYLDASSGAYYASITNTGGDTMFLSKTVIQNYVSTNNTTHQVAAGGSVLSFGDKKYLLANENYVVPGFGFYASGMNSYSYVFASLYYTTTSCGSGNEIVKAIVVTVTDAENRQDAPDNAIIWDANSHSFTTKDQGEWSGSLTYQLFDASGRLLIKGKTTGGERVYLPEGSGLGILTVSDDQHTISKKILR